jgi:ATP-dependent helicase/nuclease subunit B
MKAEEFCFHLKNLMIELNAEEKIKNLSNILTNLKEQSATFNERIYDNLIIILDEICSIMPNVVLSVEEFKSILLSGMLAKKISLIPAYNDAVFIGGYDGKILNTKILFCLNLTSSVPMQKADTAFISDKDIIKLKNFDVVIEPKIAVVNLRQRENAGIILSSFSEKLFLSYSVMDNKNKEQRKSELITYIKKMFLYGDIPINAISRSFLNHAIENNNNFYAVHRFTSPLPALKNFITDAINFKEGKKTDIIAASSFYNAANEQLKKEADRLLKLSDATITQKIDSGSELFIKNNCLSTTLLQGFYECPYKNFLRLGLKLKDRELSLIKANDSGNFLHAIMDKAFEIIDSLTDKEKIDLFCKKETELLLTKEPYSIMKKNPASMQSILRLSKEASRIISAIVYHNSVTAFKPLAREIKFGYEDSAYPPLELNAENIKINLYGIIDRLDISDNFIRIIDYKSGKIDKNDLFSDYYAGKKLQLWLYLNAVKSGYKPCGGYYFDLNDEFTASDNINNYKMTGITLSDDEVLQKTDSDLINNGEAITVNIKQDKNKLKGDILNEKDFENYLNYSILISENAVKEIIKGIIIPSPYKECGYCEYQGVCGYDETNGERNRTVENIKAETITQAVQLKTESGKQL